MMTKKYFDLRLIAFESGFSIVANKARTLRQHFYKATQQPIFVNFSILS